MRNLRRRNPEPPISDEVLEAVWSTAEDGARHNGAVTISEMGYRRSVGQSHPDWVGYTWASLEDLQVARNLVEEYLGTTIYEKRGWNTVSRVVNHQLSGDEEAYFRDWWTKKLLADEAQYAYDKDDQARYVYVDHYPEAPESVDRRWIGNAEYGDEYADYVVVPRGDNASPSRDRIHSFDTAVHASALSAADVTRLRKLAAKSAPKKPRARR
jgi:hypothetical protein